MMSRINLTKLITFNIFTTVLVLASDFLLDPSSSTPSTRCPSVRYQYPLKYHKNQCYQFVPVEMYWTDAESFCQQEEGRLVKIVDESLNQYIIDSLNSMSWWKNNGVWIGLNDLRKDGQWMWSNKNTSEEFHSDNTGYSSINMNYWGSGHPNGWFSGFRSCVRMVRGGGEWLWHETACYSYPWKYQFICQFDALPPPTLPPPILPSPAQLSQSRHQNDLNFENLRIGAKTSHEDLQADEKSTETSNNTAIILLIFLLSILFIILIFFLLKFRTLKRKQRLIMQTLFKNRGDKHDGGGGGGGDGGLSNIAVLEKGFLKLENSDVGVGYKGVVGGVGRYVGGVGRYLGSVGRYLGGVGGKDRCENVYVEEGTQRKMKKDEHIYEELPYNAALDGVVSNEA